MLVFFIIIVVIFVLLVLSLSNKKISIFLDGKKDIINSIVGIATILSFSFIAYQISTTESNNRDTEKQLLIFGSGLIQQEQQLKEYHEFNRLNFFYGLNKELLGNVELKQIIISHSKFKNDAQMLTWIDNFEVLNDIYNNKKLINKNEMNLYFGQYIIDTCKNDYINVFLKKHEKLHNGLRKLCKEFNK